jgi:outer membrane protein assembly factor BamB
MIYNYIIPTLSLALVLWATFGQKLPELPRRLTMIGTILVACGMWTLLRSEGITGSGGAELAWRWSKTYEEKFLAGGGGTLNAHGSAEAAPEAQAEWPGFRGPSRDGVIHGLQIGTDWANHPPQELWRRLVGPACSSYAVQGGFLCTQEHPGDGRLPAYAIGLNGKPAVFHPGYFVHPPGGNNFFPPPDSFFDGRPPARA